MRSRLLLVACAASLAIGAPAPVVAAPPARILTVRGPGNTYADVTFPTRFRLSTSAVSKTPPRYTTEATYSGVYLTPLTHAGSGAGTILLRGMPGLSDVPFPLGPQEWLAPGRYRVHLLGDASGAVRISVDGLRRSTTVVTSAPSDVTGGFLDRDVAGISTVADRTVVPLTVRPDTLTVVSAEHRSTAFYGRRETCVRSRTGGLSPCLEGNAGRGWYWGVYPIDWSIGGASAYWPGELPAGEAEVEFLDATVGVPHDFHGFTLTLHARHSR